MTTEEFNKGRLESWEKKLSFDEARVFLVLGYKKNGAYSFMCDDSLTPLKVAEKFEQLARVIRMKESKNS